MKYIISAFIIAIFFPIRTQAQLKLIREIEGNMEYISHEITQNHILKVDYDKKTICLFNDSFILKTHIDLDVPKDSQLHQVRILTDGTWGDKQETLFALTYVRYKLNNQFEDPTQRYVFPIYHTRVIASTGEEIASFPGSKEVKLVKDSKGQYLFISKFYNSETEPETTITRIYSYSK